MKSSVRRSAPIVSALAGVVLAIGSTTAGAQMRKGTVSAQSLAVYAEMSTDSDQAATLEHGTAVQILFSATTADGSWCSVANANSTTRLGYVDCKGLAIEAAPDAAALTPARGMAAPGPPPTAAQKAWALAASAIAATANHEGTSTLAADTPARAREGLAVGWDVRSREDLFNALSRLDDGQEREIFSRLGGSNLSDDQFNKVLSRLNPRQVNEARLAREYYPAHQSQSLIGWDYARYINVCRWGVSAGYITPEEAWPLVMNAARILQRSFGSWQEFGEDYMVGRKFIPPTTIGTPYESPQAAYNWLLNDPSSPWQKIPWNLPLN